MKEANLINKKDAAILVGMGKQTFHYYYKLERIPGKKLIGNVPFFDKTILSKWQPEDLRFGARRK